MNMNEFDNICTDAAIKMRKHVLPFTSPISCAKENDYGEHHGTGSYIESEGTKYLITNEHVARAINQLPITHTFWDTEDIFQIKHPVLTVTAPIDIALCLVNQSTWEYGQHNSKAIPINRFANSHDPIENELLFIAGFSGQRSNFQFEHLSTPGTPFLTQESPFPENESDANKKYHFSLNYKPDLATSVDGTSILPNPPGLSGSLVWDTKRIKYYRDGLSWKPECAKVTGIVWGWPSSEACLLATKIEFINIHELTSILGKYSCSP